MTLAVLVAAAYFLVAETLIARVRITASARAMMMPVLRFVVPTPSGDNCAVFSAAFLQMSDREREPWERPSPVLQKG